MLTILSYWYLQSPARFYRALLSGIQTVEEQVGVLDMVHNINKPLFQDYTFQGRIIGVGLRLVRIFIGLLLHTFLSIAYVALYLLWLIFPLVCLVSIFGSLFGSHSANTPLL